jgi:pimeloyl-ACP methyl ester carboxylesterase
VTGIYRSEAGEAACKSAYAAIRDRWPLPREELRVPTRFGETFVIACGLKDKPPLVLLHGAAFNSSTWFGDVPVWAADYRVYAVDVPGEPGESAPLRAPRATAAEWLGEVMAGLGVERARLVGLSLGGWIALEYATSNPERVDALALLAPGGLGGVRLGFGLQAAAFNLMGESARRRVAARLGADKTNPAGRYLATILTHFIPRTDPVRRLSPERLSRLKMPILMILGDKDALLDSNGSRRRLARAAPQAQIVTLPGIGHAVVGQAVPVRDFFAGRL